MNTRHIHVSGRRWFDRKNGNTYHTARAIIDGEAGPSVPVSYGYGSGWLQSAAEALEKAGYMPGREHHANGSAEALLVYCDRNGIHFTEEVSDVTRLADLHGGGR